MTARHRSELVEAEPGEHVVTAACRACALAAERGGPVVFSFNGDRVVVRPSDMAIPLAERWHRQRSRRQRRDERTA